MISEHVPTIWVFSYKNKDKNVMLSEQWSANLYIFYVNLILYLYYQQKKYTYIYICPQEFKMVRNRRGIWKLYLRLLCSSKILIDWLHMCIFKRLALNITIISKPHPLKSRTIKAYASCIRSLNKEGFLSCHGGLLLGVAVALKGPPILTQTESLSKINKS